MAGNANHKARIHRSRMDRWAAFDAPPRDALNNAKFSWSPAWAFASVRKVGVAQTIRAIVLGDELQVKKDVTRVWGLPDPNVLTLEDF